ncbi:vWA domain-containing protein [Rhizobium halophytocola]|uniref:Uncharacterized protein with von Willebrand factor type A (VWA) domain n=1 Tax=Rhizobium halophytocola TaxID=735519 RepID=A0ABS4DZD3_9HYPH|nr:VWA domain-containing protein [Rhizobium halophytocola]MBP1851051.1 uncharacterized protein with von Willebrand factor type A (vWA) domain [Rhizobium halophytocola]
MADGGPDGLPHASPLSGDGRLADNIVHFARVLRGAGLKPGPGAVADAILAIEAINIGSRSEFHAALSAVFIRRHEDQPVFDEAFVLFWRSRDLTAKMIALMSPRTPESSTKQKEKPGAARVGEALAGTRRKSAPEREREEVEIDARLTVSDTERLRTLDFAQMSVEELAAAYRAIAELDGAFDMTRTRRFRPASTASVIDARATMRTAMRSGGDLILPRWRTHREIAPPLVVLADISGSMSQYTRIFLHFLHALSARRRRVHTFLFGTRLTNVTRQMRARDPDVAVEACSALVQDWSGGTRIGETLREFNRLWGRRVLGQGAIVLLITDGLERAEVDNLSAETDRLHRSCRRLIWLNPLLRFDGFQAKAQGVKAMLPHVDELRPVHNLKSLADLSAALTGATGRDHHPRRFLDRGRI